LFVVHHQYVVVLSWQNIGYLLSVKWFDDHIVKTEKLLDDALKLTKMT